MRLRGSKVSATGELYIIVPEGKVILLNNIFLLVESSRIHYNIFVVTKYYSRKRRITLSFFGVLNIRCMGNY